ncbi:flagellar hook-length control protein FliK [Legionella bononiensis]|uniref:Flagellar hook-length control protein FliK n=1 Tax=Legionella bononiensis TaxID=2793102 RepID=A0ABS1WCG8_9GAMM|nr:flagellar hook-length control protein FliK [Legionella bononiensis]MBL7478919.1 flagellar hook-length control protein FliK [Legionella bononiensis]MBL7527051.1 flagellar hook-length control protein FliK [Legionella bononiensis]MBL7562020.1 flagellar hook-length control protein FliK [Legionella bononiensis]
MIDLNNLILDSFKLSDVSGAAQEQIKSVESLETKEEQSDDQLNETIIDPGSFILLFTELLLNDSAKKDALPEGMNSKNTDLINENVSEAKVDTVSVVFSGTKDQAVLEGISQALPQGDKLTESVNLSPLPTDSLDSNIALTWIDSDQFEPPLSASTDPEMYDDSETKGVEQLFVDKSNKRLEQQYLNDQLTQTDLMSNENIDSQQVEYAPVIESKDRFINDLKNGSINSLINKPGSDRFIVDQNIQSEHTLLNNNQHVTPQPELFNNQFSNYSTDADKTKHIDISLPLSNAQWADKFSEHIIWLGHHGVKSAVIKLNPEDLGPLEISVKVVKDSASVNITSHSNHVRDIVDQALPRLRELMADQGLDLAEVTVGMDGNSHQSEQNPNGFVKEETRQEIEEGALITPLKKQSSKGIIDYFA